MKQPASALENEPPPYNSAINKAGFSLNRNNAGEV
jgi:hypothetical protein